MDVTDIADYNIERMSTSSLSNFFFFLSKRNPEAGFSCHPTNFVGCVQGEIPAEAPLDNNLYFNLLIESRA
ncbi:hypothetical protein E4U42_001895 [Claviceps africana]|uniref:Uncharacterized protein n=1 Tax=Claviceps africana TaxID=83212 RepID=A0A8K0J8Y9_9HYPO|nr:hypothetical protein E4U42_001895 [Claviceps africana]